MFLKDLISEIENQIIGNSEIDILGLSYDSRKISDSYMFFALKGVHTNGIKFAEEAVLKGALCVVSEEKIDGLSCVNIIVSDVIDAMAKISAKFYDYPDKKMTVIGVTGTNGKTSITYMTESLFKSLGVEIGVIGTINHRYADKKIDASNTTPHSLDLYKMMSEMLAHNIKYLIMEVSSHSLVLGRVKGIEFDIAVWTNLTPDHLDFHKNMDTYFEAKSLLFSSLQNNTKQNRKYEIINIDDVYGKKLFEKNLKVQKISYSVKDKTAQINASDIQLNNDSSSFQLTSVFGDKNITIQHIGLHNVYNILAVFAICMASGFKFHDIINRLENTLPAPGRFEKIISKNGFTVIVDYAHTNDALQNVLSAIKNLNHNKIITIFGCGGNRDKTKRPLMAQTACSLSDFVFITSDNPREEDPVLIVEEVESGAKKINKTNYKVIIDRREAIREAIKSAGKNDIVLLAGKGHETYQIIGTTKFHFDDKEEVLKLI
ncbi:MAG: UDP-N-acetylmuramoyl-L-alanyl-D-glutamate--2,6-diaminopimelate ligase [Endomicrobiaceae bacterium]|nr:UDP-N-acetylmuramoyl-L-alanyl-D-glutamate--2,6-diaminopimelate ligase [Endomicrobiaceae bacterium]